LGGFTLFSSKIQLNSLQRRTTKPMRPKQFTPSNISVLKHLRSVISSTEVPSWVSSVPHNWGSASMGTPKADEWRIMAMIYFPISLITLWGGAADDENGRSRRRLLELTMCIVQATWLLCGRQTSKEDRSAYLKYMCTYLYNLEKNVQGAKYRPNHHFSLHLYEFLELYGPVHSWWCFPYERINGMLQRIATNNLFGACYSFPRSSLTKRIQALLKSRSQQYSPV
jgi:hypothetical protein